MLIPGAVLASFKPNGLPTLLIFGILISLFKKHRLDKNIQVDVFFEASFCSELFILSTGKPELYP
jgi:hypothetical protein